MGEKSPAQTRAGKIIIPRVEFRESSLRAAFDFLSMKSRQLDPDELGINVILAPSETEIANGRQPDFFEILMMHDPPDHPDLLEAQQPDFGPSVTLQLEKVSVADAITRTAEAVGVGPQG